MLFKNFGSAVLVLRLGIILVGLLSLSACQVKPLYGTSNAGSLPAVSISKAKDRLGLEVRNHLNVLLDSNSSVAAPEYQLNLTVSQGTAGLLDSGTDNNFTAGTMTVTGTYTLSRIDDETVLLKSERKATAQYDLPNQEFAKIRALQDAQDRAARELAEFIKADIIIAITK